MVALATLAPARADAQASVGAAVGVTVPLGGTADALDIGDQSGLFIVFRPPAFFRLARVDFTWSNLGDRVATSTHRFFWTTIAVVIIPDSAREPSGYVILGMGAYHQSRLGARRDAFGVNAGAGIDFAVGPFGAFAEARAHYLADGLRTKLFPIGLGIRF